MSLPMSKGSYPTAQLKLRCEKESRRLAKKQRAAARRTKVAGWGRVLNLDVGHQRISKIP